MFVGYIGSPPALVMYSEAGSPSLTRSPGRPSTTGEKPEAESRIIHVKYSQRWCGLEGTKEASPVAPQEGLVMSVCAETISLVVLSWGDTYQIICDFDTEMISMATANV